MPRCLLYVRISELTDETTSPERQRADCTRYANTKGWDIVGIYEDLDISGTKGLGGRPGLQAAIEAVERGDADYLVAAKIDRVARSVITYHEVVKRLADSGASLVSVAEGLDFSTPGGKMTANVLAAFAQFESESIGARVKSAKTFLVGEGKWPGGRRPFGWRPAPHDSGKGWRLALDPVEAPILREMTSRILDGEAVGAVAGDLNRRGIRTALGREWVGETVRKALTKPAMVGRHGAERLIGDADYARLQHRLTRGAPSQTQWDHAPVLLAPSVISCARCRVPMRHATQSGGRSVYRCTSRPAPGAGGCFLCVSAPRLDAYVEKWLLARFGRMQLATPPRAEVVDPVAEERADIRARMSELEQDRYVRGLFSGEEGAERFERIYRSLEDLLNDLPEPRVIADPGPASLIPAGVSFGEAWTLAAPEERRAWVEEIMEDVAVSPGTGGRRFEESRVAIRLNDRLDAMHDLDGESRGTPLLRSAGSVDEPAREVL